MAQLKVKQISDFVSAVEAKVNGIVGTETVSAISVAKSEAKADASLDASTKANAAESKAISTAVSADVVVLSSAKSYADEAEADALSNAKVYADSKDVLVLSEAKAHSDIQKGRIDVLLQDADTTLDTFNEISSFITSLETSDVAGLSAALSTAVSNDAVHSTAISTNAQAIADLDYTGDFDALGSADAAYDAAVAESTRLGNLAYDGLGSADTAEANAIASAKSYTDGREVIIKGYADQAEADAISSANTYTDTEIAAIDLRIDGLEGASFEEVVANFVAADQFTSTLKFDLGNVKVFVNGLQIHEASEGIDGWRSTDGLNFTVVGLGYDLEADDHIIVSGKLA